MEQRFETLFEQAPLSMQLLALDGRTLRVNRAWEALWGVSDADGVKAYVLGEYNILADPQLEAGGVAAALRRAFAGESVELPTIHYDPARLGKPGRARWVRAFAHPIRGADGELREVMLIHEDVTERRSAEAALRESEMRLKQLANSIPQLVWIADAAGDIQWYNDRWYEYTGTTPEQMMGWGWQAVHDPATLPEVLARWKASLASGEPFRMTFPLLGRDGRFRPFLTLVAPLTDDAGRVTQWFGTNTDVSALSEAQEALREADRRKDEFLAMLAHELRNPLAPISAAAQLLRLGVDDAAKARRAAEMIHRQVTHITRLVDDLLDVSRVTRGLIRLERAPVDLAEVVEAAIEQSGPLLEAKSHRLHRSLVPVVVSGDRSRLVQVVANLLNNAARYMPDGGRIDVEVAREGDVAVLAVRDAGVGIAPELLPRVFELFARGERALDAASGGLGIGLALARRLVELHGGRIEAASGGRGAGSTFTVRLPCAP